MSSLARAAGARPPACSPTLSFCLTTLSAWRIEWRAAQNVLWVSTGTTPFSWPPCVVRARRSRYPPLHAFHGAVPCALIPQLLAPPPPLLGGLPTRNDPAVLAGVSSASATSRSSAGATQVWRADTLPAVPPASRSPYRRIGDAPAPAPSQSVDERASVAVPTSCRRRRGGGGGLSMRRRCYACCCRAGARVVEVVRRRRRSWRRPLSKLAGGNKSGRSGRSGSDAGGHAERRWGGSWGESPARFGTRGGHCG